MGATHFLMKTLPHVATEMALHVLAYNLTRVMNIIGIKPADGRYQGLRQRLAANLCSPAQVSIPTCVFTRPRPGAETTRIVEGRFAIRG